MRYGILHIFFGLGFLFGAWLLRRQISKKAVPSGMSPFIWVLGIMGSLMIVWAFVSEQALLMMSQELCDVRRADPQQIHAVELHPYNTPGIQTIGAAEALRTESNEVIAEISRCLREATPWSPNHPGTIWQCELVLDYGSRHASCRIEKTRNNGFLLSVSNGKGQWKWHLRDYRNDDLEAILTDAFDIELEDYH